MGLEFEAIQFPWGSQVDLGRVRDALSELSGGWLWCTHCETSSGVLNDLNRLKTLCSELKIKLCVDCISSIGTIPVGLRGVHLATCASGKGLRAYPGLSMVFYNHEIQPKSERLPRYLDLNYYATQQGIPFTFSSNLLHALHAAVKRVPWEKRFAELVERSAWLRPKLRELGFELVGDAIETSPPVITIALPESMNSIKIGTLIQESGYLLSYNSEYLKLRNWIQICMMGECAQEKLVSLLNALNRVCFKRRGGKNEASEASAGEKVAG